MTECTNPEDRPLSVVFFDYTRLAGRIVEVAKELGFESGVSYAKLGMLEPESCARLLEALPAGNGAPFA